MTDISTLSRHLMRQVELGRGIRLSAEQLDLLVAVGAVDLLAQKAVRLEGADQAQRDMRRAGL